MKEYKCQTHVEIATVKSTPGRHSYFSNMTNAVIFVTKVSLGVAKITTVPFNLPRMEIGLNLYIYVIVCVKCVYLYN